MMTEVEDATRLFARHRPDAARILRRYQGLIDAVVASCRGTPLVEGGVGDSTLALFARASDALACALGVQRAIVGGEGQGRRLQSASPHTERGSDSVDLSGITGMLRPDRALAHCGQVFGSDGFEAFDL